MGILYLKYDYLIRINVCSYGKLSLILQFVSRVPADKYA